jgi:hypothetical protein
MVNYEWAGMKSKAVSYSVAMSTETGCLVMVQIVPGKNGSTNLKVMGSLDRDASVKLAQELVDWVAEIPRVIAPREKKLLKLVQ